MKRDRATTILQEMIERLCAPDRDPLLNILHNVDVFGSYARGAPEPNDIDLNIDFDGAASLEHFTTTDFLQGKVTRTLKRALLGGTRGVEMIAQARQNPGSYPFPLTLLWKRGDDLSTCLARLHAIGMDLTAGTAPREHMLPAFDGLEKWLPVYLRDHIHKAAHAGAIKVEQITLPAITVKDPAIDGILRARWSTTSPLYRAGHAILAHYEQRGIDPGAVHLHGRDVRDTDTPYFGGFGCRYMRHVPDWFTEWGGIEHTEIPRKPTSLNQPLIALAITAVDITKFEQPAPIWSL